MELESKICYRCGLDISETHDFYQVDVCTHCGWIQNFNHQDAEKAVDKKSVFGILGVVFALGLIIAQAANWGNYSIEVLPLQVKNYTGLASENDYARMADMCESLKRYECVENMLVQRAEVSPNNLEAYAELGLVQYQRRNFKEALKNLAHYVNAGGANAYSNYIYAKALGESGQIEVASRIYKKLLAAKPNTLQITVTQSYVQLLVKNGLQKQAEALVKATRQKGSNADFMKTEMRQLASTKS